VLAVITPANVPRLPKGGKAAVNPPAGRVLSLLQDDQVAYSGQPIALVVADTHEHAQAAAAMVQARYERADAAIDVEAARAKAHAPEKVNTEKPDSKRGDPEGALAQAAAVHRARYETPVEHHNPMEPHATVAAWSDGVVTVYDSTQYVTGVKETLAKTLGIP